MKINSVFGTERKENKFETNKKTFFLFIFFSFFIFLVHSSVFKSGPIYLLIVILMQLIKSYIVRKKVIKPIL